MNNTLAFSTLAIATACSASGAHAQPEFSYSIFDSANNQPVTSETSDQPLVFQDSVGDFFAILQTDAFGVEVYAGDDVTGPDGLTLAATTRCDDFIITGPAGPTVLAQLQLEASAAASRPLEPGTVDFQLFQPDGSTQTLVWSYEASTEPSQSFRFNDVLIYDVELPVGTPFTLGYGVTFDIGGDTAVGNSLQITGGAAYDRDQVLLLPEGYTINSECASIEDNDLKLPCIIDLNQDGFLDNGDITLFISYKLSQDIRADINGDGFCDNGDIGLFVSLFLAGC